jgi:uncharacterized membrane protein
MLKGGQAILHQSRNPRRLTPVLVSQRTISYLGAVLLTTIKDLPCRFAKSTSYFTFSASVYSSCTGFVLERHYRKAADIQAKATLLGIGRTMGLMGPIAIAVMLLTGITNMYFLGMGLFDFGWLTAKVIFFAIAAVNGLMFGGRSRKRGMLVMQMVKGETPADAETKIREIDRQQNLFFIVNGILLLLIVTLSVYGRLGEQ